MTRKHQSALSLAGLLLVPAISFIPFTAKAVLQPEDAKEYKIERTFKKGDKNRYNVILKAKGNNANLGGDIKVTMDVIMRETVNDVKDNTAEYQSECEKALASLEGFGEQDITSQFPKVMYKGDKTGKMWDIKSEGGDDLIKGGANGGGNELLVYAIRSMFYPNKPIKAGDSWDIEVTTPDVKDKDGKAIVLTKGKAKIVGTEKIAGFEGVKIKALSDIMLDPKEKTPLKFEGEGVIDTASGKLLLVKGNLDGILPPLGKSKTDVSISLMKEDAKLDVKDKKDAEKGSKGEGEKKPL